MLYVCRVFTMDKLLTTVRKFYPQNKAITFISNDVSPGIIQKLINEFHDGRYSDVDAALKYLATCDTHIVATSDHVKMNIITSKKYGTTVPQLLVTRLMRRIECLISMFNPNQSPLTFWIIPTHARRKFPCDKAVICPKHINGGFTYPSLREIYIFRLEEFPKVVLHETIHNLPLDSSNLWTQEALRNLYEIFDIDSTGCPIACHTSLNPNEAIVETWANIFQILFISFEYNIDWNKLFRIEQEWALRQACKLLMKQKKMEGQWKEETHSYSYIVIKAIILWNVHKFIKLYPYDPTKFASTIYEIIKDTLQNQKFRNTISMIHKSKGILRDSSLRMTILGDM